jgi:hypothetical protein
MSPRGHRAAAPAGDSRSARPPELWLYATGTLLWVSGVGWLASHYLLSARDAFGELTHPWDAWWLRLHGASMMAFLVAFGALVPTHMLAAWRRRTNRRSGLFMLALVAVLALTGYGLYYSGDEELRPWISALHWGLGLAAAAALLVHRLLGKRRHRRMLTPQFARAAPPAASSQPPRARPERALANPCASS